ncbi:MAG: cadherin domain-containing protein, partial [Ekhidna sp.]|nr:cadherin domain-containing protein [Ekhidna sp.]
QTFSVPEDAMNGTAVGTVQATDPEEDNLTFAISKGNTGDVFTIVEGTGAITTAGTLDFEITQSYTLTISVSDGKLSATADITVNVTDVNDNAPTIAEQTFSVPEDAVNGTAVGTVLAADADMDNLMFSITSGNTGDVFAINTTTGAITTAGTLDFETAPTYTLTVSVSDGNLSATADITVKVTDVDETATERTAIATALETLKGKQDRHIQPTTDAEAKTMTLKTGTPTPENIQDAKDAIAALKVQTDELTKLQNDIDAISARITALEAAGNAPAGTLQPLKTSLEARKRTQTQITSAQAKLTALESEIDGLEEKIAIETLLSTLEGKQDGHLRTTNIADVQMKIATLKATINSANFVAARQAIEAVTALDGATLTALQGDIEAISAKITALENAGNAPAGTIQPLKDALAARKTAQTVLSNGAAGLTTELHKITVPAKTTALQTELNKSSRDYDAILMLIEEGADVNAKSNTGNTALILAAFLGRTATVNALLSVSGINVNIQNDFGNTALIWAAEQGHKDIVDALLDVSGINVNLRNNVSFSALDLANTLAADNANKTAIITALKAKDAKTNMQIVSGG